MKKIKEFSKKYLIGFFIGLILFTVVGVYATTYFPSNQTTYDNSASGLSSTNVQGAIDELYNVCFPPTAGDSILDNVDIVTSGDGLYEDEYEDGKYTYKGANPNNYVTFNNEKAGWRIISINSDGTIKIMREASIGDIKWDSSQNNNWTRPASLNTYLNGPYYLNEDYYNSLTSTAQSQIVSEDWSIGEVKIDNNDLADQINDENSEKWNGKIALVTVSEYIRSNSNKSSCGTFSENNSHYNSCKNSTWMYNSNDYWWTLSPNVVFSNYLFMLRPSGDIVNGFANGKNTMVRLAVYLSSDIQITGGNGSSSNPYILSET